MASQGFSKRRGIENGWNLNPNSLAFRYFLTISAASISETATYPLDLIKTRLQIQKLSVASKTHNHPKAHLNAAGPKYHGVVSIFMQIVKKEGLFRLWSGLPPAVYRHMIYSGFRIMTYEKFRGLLGQNEDGSFSIWKSCVAGSTAGALGQLIASPMDLLKVQMQTEGIRRLKGEPVRFRNSLHAMRVLLSEGGVLGLWRGWLPNCQRAALVNLGELATYDQVKRKLLIDFSMKDNALTHSLSSAASGLVAALVGTPADVIKTRIMNQPVDQSGKPLVYKGVVDCLRRTVGEEGVLALWKGFVPIWSRMAPWSLVFWISYEKIRYFAGVPSF
ncbi:mitochondrial uncoupling protein 4-like [Symsagittifera roscoffensis]|uniref:mitochondrial uncoupling protein 4-like n=1 Tax=Symsagittifera roscoffensis TaxID=84072 RepID=UPI00307BB37A